MTDMENKLKESLSRVLLSTLLSSEEETFLIDELEDGFAKFLEGLKINEKIKDEIFNFFCDGIESFLIILFSKRLSRERR